MKPLRLILLPTLWLFTILFSNGDKSEGCQVGNIVERYTNVSDPDTGFYLLNITIPCSGILQSIIFKGECLIRDNTTTATNKTVYRMRINHIDSELSRVINTSTIRVRGSECSELVNITNWNNYEVTAGNYFAVEIRPNFDEIFLPVFMTNDSSDCILFNTSRSRNLGPLCSMYINMEAYISPHPPDLDETSLFLPMSTPSRTSESMETAASSIEVNTNTFTLPFTVTSSNVLRVTIETTSLMMPIMGATTSHSTSPTPAISSNICKVGNIVNEYTSPSQEESGFYLLNITIPCSGILQSITFKGECLIRDNTKTATKNTAYRMRINHIDSELSRVIESRNIRVRGSECSDLVNITNWNNYEVTAGNYFAVEIPKSWNQLYLPVFMTNDSSDCILFNTSRSRNLSPMCSIYINMEAYILPHPPNGDTNRESITAEVLVPSVIVPSLLFIGILATIVALLVAYKRRRDLRVAKLNDTSRSNDVQLSYCSSNLNTNYTVYESIDQERTIRYSFSTASDHRIEHRESTLATNPEPHYMFASNYDTAEEESPYWEPTCSDYELRAFLKEFEISEDIKLYDELGRGEFGVVRKGILAVEGDERVVAVKSLTEGFTEEERTKFLQEAAIMCQFKHPNVVNLHGVVLDKELPLLVVEFMAKGSLKEYLLSIAQSLSEQGDNKNNLPALLLSFCRQIASGMTYLSCRGFVHRDLAARNILLTDREVCKIADFGMSRALMDTDYYLSHGGKIPVKWTAPEALLYKKYSTASDVWGFGMIMYEIWSVGLKPFNNLNNQEALKEIQAGRVPHAPPGCPRHIYLIMMGCWRMSEDSRPAFSDLLQQLQHPDFKLLTWTAEDESRYNEEARTLGSALEAGETLFTDLFKQ